MWFTLIFIITITLLFCIYKRRTRNSQYWKYISEIPGPKGKPIIGNLLEALNEPEQLFKNRRIWAKKYFPIYKTVIFNIPIVCIIHPEDIEQLILNKAHETKGMAYSLAKNWLGDGLLLSNGTKWKSRRKILTPAFHFSILQEFTNIFNKETEHLIEELEKHCDEPYIDVMKPVTEFTLCSIIETSMGIKLNQQKTSDLYKQAVIDMGHILIHKIGRPWLIIPAIYKMTTMYQIEQYNVNILHKLSRDVIKERKKNFDFNTYSAKKRKAMLDLLLSAQQIGANIDDAGISEEVDTFLFAGHDTTATAISYALMALSNEKHIQEEIVKEIREVLGDSEKLPTFSELQQLSFMERCIKECLRIYPTVPMINRIAGEDMKTRSGYTIPKGTNIFVFIYDMHRSSEFWENPLKFDPDRFLPENVAKRHPFSFIPFSAGSRNCLGQKYALAEIKAALCGILRKFRLEPVDTPESQRYYSDMILRPFSEIRTKFIPRK